MKHFLFVSQILLILVLNSSLIFAQPISSSIILDNIQINNQETLINDDNEIYGKEGDAIRIAGKLLSGDGVKVFVGDKEYAVTIDENMNWFVLFSITGFTEEKYPIEAQLVNQNQNGEKVLLTTLVVGEKPVTEEESNNLNQEKSDSNFDFKNILIIVLLLLFIYLLLKYLISRSKVEKRSKEKK